MLRKRDFMRSVITSQIYLKQFYSVEHKELFAPMKFNIYWHSNRETELPNRNQACCICFFHKMQYVRVV